MDPRGKFFVLCHRHATPLRLVASSSNSVNIWGAHDDHHRHHHHHLPFLQIRRERFSCSGPAEVFPLFVSDTSSGILSGMRCAVTIDIDSDRETDCPRRCHGCTLLCQSPSGPLWPRREHIIAIYRQTSFICTPGAQTAVRFLSHTPAQL